MVSDFPARQGIWTETLTRWRGTALQTLRAQETIITLFFHIDDRKKTDNSLGPHVIYGNKPSTL